MGQFNNLSKDLIILLIEKHPIIALLLIISVIPLVYLRAIPELLDWFDWRNKRRLNHAEELKNKKNGNSFYDEIIEYENFKIATGLRFLSRQRNLFFETFKKLNKNIDYQAYIDLFKYKFLVFDENNELKLNISKSSLWKHLIMALLNFISLIPYLILIIIFLFLLTNNFIQDLDKKFYSAFLIIIFSVVSCFLIVEINKLNQRIEALKGINTSLQNNLFKDIEKNFIFKFAIFNPKLFYICIIIIIIVVAIGLIKTYY